MNSNKKETQHRRSSFKKVTFKFFAIFTGKHLCCSLFLLKLQEETPTQVFRLGVSCEYRKILKNTYFEEDM